MKILIVGGVAGGATAAARLRRLNENDQIIMFERNEQISFANCGLPYFIGEVIKDAESLEVNTVEGFSTRYNIDVRNNTEVLSIDRPNKRINVRNSVTGDMYFESYDKLILSPGAKPIVLPIQGIEDATNMFTLRNIPDTYKIYEYSKNIKKAAILGGGYIGVEVAENLARRGIEVTIVNLDNQVILPADFEMAQILQEELERNGIKLHLNDSVHEIKDNGHLLVTRNGVELETDMIIRAIGVSSENKLAGSSGLQLTSHNSISVDLSLRTSDEDIYAVGDAIEVPHFITGEETRIPLAGPANRQARLAADGINGLYKPYSGAQASSIIQVFDLIFATTGLNEKQAISEGIDYEVIYTNKCNHANYYPGATPIQLKLIYRKKDKLILGAQAVGKEGTDKRIDIIATAIRFKAKVTDLAELELCYAPQFSNAKDPVNILGYIADNIINGSYNNLRWQDMQEIEGTDNFILDVRQPNEFAQGFIEGAINIELDVLRNNIDKLPKDKTKNIYIYCKTGFRSYLACCILKGYGYTNVFNLAGGYYIYDYAVKRVK